MPKRSRSSSPPPSSPPHASTELAMAAHAPKYHRGSLSPSPSPTPRSPTAAAAAAPRPMQCTLPPHPPLALASAAAFDVHYAREHTNRCAACQVNLPAPWLLELHLAERHDPLVAARREKEEKTYKCFVPTCDKVTLTPQKRRLHLIDKHGYPRNYYFRIVETGQGKRMSLLKGGGNGAGRRRRLSDVGGSGWQDHARERNGIAGGRGSAETHEEESAGGSDVEVDDAEEGPVNSRGKGNGAKGAAKGPVKPKPTRADTKQKSDDGVDSLVDSVAALRFVPLSVRLRDKRPAT